MMKQTYQPLFEPFTFESGVTIPNRISVAPMTHYSSNDDGTISDRELSYITPRSKEMGMVITACANVTPDGKAFPGQPGIYDDSHIPGLKNSLRRSSLKERKPLCRFTTEDWNALLNSCQTTTSSVRAAQKKTADKRPGSHRTRN